MNNLILDTNIFLRHLLQDIPEQSEKAKAIIDSIETGEKTGLISILVVNELIWILEHYYELKRKVYLPKLIKLLSIEQIKIMETRKDAIIKILEKMQKQKFDFTDMYLVYTADSEHIVSFDKDLEKIRKGSP